MASDIPNPPPPRQLTIQEQEEMARQQAMESGETVRVDQRDFSTVYEQGIENNTVGVLNELLKEVSTAESPDYIEPILDFLDSDNPRIRESVGSLQTALEEYWKILHPRKYEMSYKDGKRVIDQEALDRWREKALKRLLDIRHLQKESQARSETKMTELKDLEQKGDAKTFDEKIERKVRKLVAAHPDRDKPIKMTKFKHLIIALEHSLRYVFNEELAGKLTRKQLKDQLTEIFAQARLIERSDENLTESIFGVAMKEATKIRGENIETLEEYPEYKRRYDKTRKDFQRLALERMDTVFENFKGLRYAQVNDWISKNITRQGYPVRVQDAYRALGQNKKLSVIDNYQFVKPRKKDWKYGPNIDKSKKVRSRSAERQKKRKRDPRRVQTEKEEKTFKIPKIARPKPKLKISSATFKRQRSYDLLRKKHLSTLRALMTQDDLNAAAIKQLEKMKITKLYTDVKKLQDEGPVRDLPISGRENFWQAIQKLYKQYQDHIAISRLKKKKKEDLDYVPPSEYEAEFAKPAPVIRRSRRTRKQAKPGTAMIVGTDALQMPIQATNVEKSFEQIQKEAERDAKQEIEIDSALEELRGEEEKVETQPADELSDLIDMPLFVDDQPDELLDLAEEEELPEFADKPAPKYASHPDWVPGLTFTSHRGSIQVHKPTGKFYIVGKFLYGKKEFPNLDKSVDAGFSMRSRLFDTKLEAEQFQNYLKNIYNNVAKKADLPKEFRDQMRFYRKGRSGERNKDWYKAYEGTKLPDGWRKVNVQVKAKGRGYREIDLLNVWDGPVPPNILQEIQQYPRDPKNGKMMYGLYDSKGIKEVGKTISEQHKTFYDLRKIILTILQNEDNWKQESDSMTPVQVEKHVFDMLKTYGIDRDQYSAIAVNKSLLLHIRSLIQEVERAFVTRDYDKAQKYARFFNVYRPEIKLVKSDAYDSDPSRSRSLSTIPDLKRKTFDDMLRRKGLLSTWQARDEKSLSRETEQGFKPFADISRSRSPEPVKADSVPEGYDVIRNEIRTELRDAIEIFRALRDVAFTSAKGDVAADNVFRNMSGELTFDKYKARRMEFIYKNKLPWDERSNETFNNIVFEEDQLKEFKKLYRIIENPQWHEDNWRTIFYEQAPTVPREPQKAKKIVMEAEDVAAPTVPKEPKRAKILEPIIEDEKLEEKEPEIKPQKRRVRKKAKRHYGNDLTEPVGNKGYYIRLLDNQGALEILKDVRRKSLFAQNSKGQILKFQARDVSFGGRTLSLPEFISQHKTDLAELEKIVGSQNIAEVIYRNLLFLGKRNTEYQKIAEILRFGKKLKKKQPDLVKELQKDPATRKIWQNREQITNDADNIRAVIKTLSPESLSLLNEMNRAEEERTGQQNVWGWWLPSLDDDTTSQVTFQTDMNTFIPQDMFGRRLFARFHATNVPGYLMEDFIEGRLSEHRVQMFNKTYENVPLNTFPYKEGEYAIDDKGWGDQFEGFIRAAHNADPLSKMRGKKSQIGNYISLLATPERYHIVVYKDVPPRALKTLCSEIKKHVKSLSPLAHVELFREVGSQYKLVLSADRVRQIGLAALARIIISFVSKKKKGHYVHFILLQTIPGGSLHSYGGFL